MSSRAVWIVGLFDYACFVKMLVNMKLLTLLPSEDERQHSAQAFLGASNPELVKADQEGDCFGHIREIGARQKLR